jgi:hypothetical protein
VPPPHQRAPPPPGYSVLLYLSPEDARAALADIVRNSLAPGGYLVIGDTEMIPDDMFPRLGLVQASSFARPHPTLKEQLYTHPTDFTRPLRPRPPGKRGVRVGAGRRE